MTIRKAIVFFTVFLLLFGLGNSIFAKVKSISFFSPKSMYFYFESSYYGINPYDPYSLGNYELRYTNIYGVGYTILNMYDKYKISFEFDYASPHYNRLIDDLGLYDQQVDFYNYKISFEYLFRNSRFSLFSGMGASHIVFRENSIFYQYDIDTYVFELGVKYFFSKHLAIRSEYKVFSYSKRYYDYYDDDYPMASAFALGLELKL